MSSALWHELADALLELEMGLRRAGLWSDQAPSARQLASETPFCIDTLTFDQWLQWLFLPRMAAIFAAGQPLPGAFRIAPMGEDAFAALGEEGSQLTEVLQRIDRLAGELG